MATQKSSQRTYNVQARLWLDTAIDVQAASLDAAIGVSKNLSITDFITIKGDHNDSKMRVIGVFEAYTEPKI